MSTIFSTYNGLFKMGIIGLAIACLFTSKNYNPRTLIEAPADQKMIVSSIFYLS